MAAPRVSECDVQAIIETNIENLRPFIVSADTMVTEYLSSSGLSDALLKEITKWLAAHMVASVDRREKSESFGDASRSFDGQTGMGLDATMYGQQAKLLDTTGTLATIGKRKVFFEVL